MHLKTHENSNLKEVILFQFSNLISYSKISKRISVDKELHYLQNALLTLHIRHDLEGQVNKPKEEMTPEEQSFYYFKLHDTNNDNQLDGLEVISAFNHVHDDDVTMGNSTNLNQTSPTPATRLADEELIRLVDDILKEEDDNQDGFISYQEFKRSVEDQGTHK
ncbi:unnamed protein product [Didymodactylos carnosus]|uniref:EF-hand domain-containing protein n=1 Tax=Didymodactylos carnosus TaxID=1234261 RepID=A0A814EN03_9BILA|nr:unnamed protein product [Didymodactylos carnosus]CAF3744725.1 unnamed protein product [Didymodactylos carnosus]